MKNNKKIISKNNKELDIEILNNHINNYLWKDINDPIFRDVIMVHMIVDEIMDYIIEKEKLYNRKTSFIEKTKLLYENSIIDEKLYFILNEFNRIRNNYAHYYLYQVKEKEIYELISLANKYNIYYDMEAYADKSKYKNESTETIIFIFLYNLTLKLSEMYL